MRIWLLAGAALLAAAPAAAAPADDFRRLLDDHYAWLLRESPTYATALGVRDHDDRIEDISLAARDRQAREAAAFLARLERIPAEALSPADRVNRAILKRGLEEGIEANRFGQRVMLFTTYAGWHQAFAGLADNLPFRTKADYESYLTRLALYPRQNDAALDITGQAVRGGFVLPCSVLGNYEKGIAGVIAEDPAKSRFYEPFTRHSARRRRARRNGRRCRRGRGGWSPTCSTRLTPSISLSTEPPICPNAPKRTASRRSRAGANITPSGSGRRRPPT